MLMHFTESDCKHKQSNINEREKVKFFIIKGKSNFITFIFLIKLENKIYVIKNTKCCVVTH